MTDTSPSQNNNPALGIFFIVLGMSSISINDTLMKALSSGYPLHQLVFVRSVIGITISLIIVQFEGGFGILRTDKPFLHLLRGLLVVLSNMTFFAALAVIPLGDATALFFVAPLFITVLSIPILGEKVGTRRLSAVIIGFIGVLVMMQPWDSEQMSLSNITIMMLPVAAAFTYALMQILTRRLGVTSKASAMAVYIQGTFILVSSMFWFIAGDGQFLKANDHESLQFLLRAWLWPSDEDIPLFLGLGVASSVVAYSLSQAYRSAPAATIAPFEYVALPLAILWGWTFWGDIPNMPTFAGIAFIVGSGIYVFLREGQRHRPVATRRPIRRW